LIVFDEPKYGRTDVDYETWYSAWSKRLAKSLTKEEIEGRSGMARKEASRASSSHLRAIKKTHSMTGNSQARAQSGNVVRAAGEEMLALSGAWEIHLLFPEHAKQASIPAHAARHGARNTPK
jgi:hypothetical protein